VRPHRRTKSRFGLCRFGKSSRSNRRATQLEKQTPPNGQVETVTRQLRAGSCELLTTSSGALETRIGPCLTAANATDHAPTPCPAALATHRIAWTRTHGSAPLSASGGLSRAGSSLVMGGLSSNATILRYTG
jgi:hypothetical protein